MNGIEMLPVSYVPFVSVMMTALFSAGALVAGMGTPRRRQSEVDPATLMLAACTFFILGVLIFALIYVSAPQLRHFAHSAF